MILIGSVSPRESEPRIYEAKFEASDILAMFGDAMVPFKESSVARDATCLLKGVTKVRGWSPRYACFAELTMALLVIFKISCIRRAVSEEFVEPLAFDS